MDKLLHSKEARGQYKYHYRVGLKDKRSAIKICHLYRSGFLSVGTGAQVTHVASESLERHLRDKHGRNPLHGDNLLHGEDSGDSDDLASKAVRVPCSQIKTDCEFICWLSKALEGYASPELPLMDIVAVDGSKPRVQ